MSKSIKRGLFNGSVVIASSSAVGATSAIIIHTNQLHPREVKRIIDEIKEQISLVNNTNDKLEQNKGSVDSLKNAINEAEQKLTQFNQKFNEYNKEEYKTNNKINNEINNFKNSISELEAKIKDSKLRYEQNKFTFDSIYAEAKQTSDEAKKQLKQTSEIDKPRLQEADDKLQQALKKVEEAKEKVKDSQSHVDNLSVLNDELKQATDEVKKLIDELKNLSEEQKNNKYLRAVNKVNNELKDRINKAANLADNVKEIEDFISDLETNITKANGTVKIVESEEGLSHNVLAANDQLKDTISQSEQTLKDAKIKLAVISNNIDEKLNKLETKIKESKQKIANSTDFDELSKEFENYNITNEAIKDLETKIKEAEYDKGLKRILQLNVDNENNKSTSLDKMKNAITEVLKAANSLKEEQIENFSVKITLANTAQELANIRHEINLANKKEQAKKFVSALENLSKDEIDESIRKINESDESNLEKIKEEYSKINEEKGKLIDEIKTFDFTDEYKNQLADNIKSKNLNQATEFKEEIKQINDSKTEVKAFIDNIENKIPDTKKTELKVLLTKAQSKAEAQKVQNQAQLEKAKQNAIEEINKLNVDNKEQLIAEINNKNDEAGIRAVVAKAKGDVLEAEKLEAESNINQLEFISANEKAQKIEEIKNKTNENKEQIKQIVEELSNKNKEKQDLFDNHIKNNDIFTKEFIEETKNKLINEDNKEKYIKIKDDFVSLKTQKEELIKKIGDKTTYPNLGDKDKQNLKDELKQAIDSQSINEVESKASQLNDEKQKLISEVDKLEKVDSDKASAKEQIISANGKVEAQKIYDKLKIKSDKEKAKAQIDALEYLSNAEKTKFIDEISKINTNTQNIQSILNAAKQKDDAKKEYHDGLNAFNSSFNDSLINAKKQEIKNSDLNNAKSIYDNLKQLHDKMNTVKAGVKNEVDSEFNEKGIGIGHRDYYKALVDKVKYNDNDLDTNSKSLLSTFNDIKYAAKWQTELYIYDTIGRRYQYKLLLNESEIQSAKNKVDQIRAKNNSAITLDTLNELKTALHEVETLHREKIKIKDKLNTLIAIKATLRENAKNNVKNQTKEEADSKFEELNELNTQIISAHNRLDGSEFAKLSPDRRQYYKNQISNIDNKDQIEQILNNAKHEINVNEKKKAAIEEINALEYLNNDEKQNSIREVNAINTNIPDIQNILNAAKQKNYTKQTYHNGLDILKPSFSEKIINDKKREIKNLNENESLALYNKLKEKHLTLEREKTRAKAAVDSEFNLKSIGVGYRSWYKELVNMVKYLDNELDTNSNSHLSTLEDIKYAAKWNTELFTKRTQGQEHKYKLLLNDYEMLNAINKVIEIKGRNGGVITLSTLNEVKTTLQDVENLHKEKEKIQEKYDTLTDIKESLRDETKNNIKNITKEEAENKFRELSDLNDEIKNALSQLEQDTFSKLDQISKDLYKIQIKDVDRKEQIQTILDIAKAQVRRNELKEQTKGKIDKLLNISRNGITNFKNRIDSAPSENEITNILKEAETLNNNKNAVITQVSQAYNSSQIPENAKNDLISRLKSDDSAGTKQVIQNELDRWKTNYQPHIKAIESLNKISTIMQNMLNNNADPNLSTQVEKFKKFVDDNSFKNDDNLSTLEFKKIIVQGNDLTSNIDELNRAISNSFDYYKNTMGEKVKDKDELSKLRQKMDSDIEKINSIKTELITTFGNQKIHESEFDKTIEKSKQLSKWISDKIALVYKHNSLIEEVQKENSLRTSQKSDLIAKINQERLKPHHLEQQYDQLESEVYSEIRKAIKLAAEYLDSIYDIYIKMVELKYHNELITSDKLKQKNNELIKHLGQQFTKYTEEYTQNVENSSIQAKGKKLKLAKDIIEKYVDTIEKSLIYIQERSKNVPIESAGWEEFYSSTIKHKNDFFEGLTQVDLENYSIDKYNLNQIMPDVYLRTKYKIFQKEVLRLIGNGNWRITDDNKLIISFMYLENEHDKYNAKPTLDQTKYDSTYYNLTINWNTQIVKDKSYAEKVKFSNSYNYHAFGISFKSGYDDNLELGLKIISKSSMINFIIPRIFNKRDYESKKHNYNPDSFADNPHNFDTNVNRGYNIREQDLIPVNI